MAWLAGTVLHRRTLKGKAFSEARRALNGAISLFRASVSMSLRTKKTVCPFLPRHRAVHEPRSSDRRASAPCNGIGIFFCVGSVLVDADRREVDHLDIALISCGYRARSSRPIACFAPAVEAVYESRVRARARRNICPRRTRAQPPGCPDQCPADHRPALRREPWSDRRSITDDLKRVRSTRA